MNKLSVLFLGLSLSMPIYAMANPEPDLKSALSKVVSGTSSSTTSSSTSSSVLSALSGLASGLISTSDVSISSMVGTWNYSSPAVCFKSDNLLKKAGGSAVASTIENKLAPYYKKSGIEKLVLTISSDGSFTMKFGKGSVSGTITEGSDGIMTFKFKALSKYNITSMNAYVTMSGTSAMSLTFDVSKLSSLVKMAGSVSGNSTIQSVSSLLDSYDGICAGFKLTKQ